MAREVVIVGAARTPIGAFQGALSVAHGAAARRHRHQGGARARGRLARTQVDEVIMGCVLQAGVGQAPARQASHLRGHPGHRPCRHAQQGVRLGPEGGHRGRPGHRARRRRGGGGGRHGVHAQRALLLHAMRGGARMGNVEFKDAMIHDGCGIRTTTSHMGMCAEECADLQGISRARAGRVRARVHPARHQGPEGGRVQGGDRRRSRCPARRASTVVVTEDEGPKNAKPEKIAVAQARVQEGRHGDGGQRFVHQRRRRGAGADERGAGQGRGPHGARPDRRLRAGGAQAGGVHHRAGRRHQQAARDARSSRPSDVDLWEINEAFAVVAHGQQQAARARRRRRSTCAAARWCSATPSAPRARALLVTLLTR